MQSSKDRECSRAKSDMTPCYIRDGEIVVIEIKGHRACVGCEVTIDKIANDDAHDR